MTRTALVLLIRFRSRLSLDEVMKVVEERAPSFEALPGLRQKYYLEDPQTGEIAGLYLWESPEAFDEYRESELRRTVSAAYEMEGEPRIEVYRVLKELRDSAG